ncbi:hypothetical protein MHU86_14189 [Fragilaria crotonensis]|nr:hypothetical protein MHU86_14189 [Fragilaria crotonensis]
MFCLAQQGTLAAHHSARPTDGVDGERVTSVPPPKPAATFCRHSLMGAPGYPTCLRLVHVPEAVVRRQSSPVADRPWQMSAVYVDDYILAAVESADGSALQRTGRAALHTIHGLFPPRTAPAMSAARTPSP